jgi:hypothetical protein
MLLRKGHIMEASPKVGLEALLTPDNCVLVLIGVPNSCRFLSECRIALSVRFASDSSCADSTGLAKPQHQLQQQGSDSSVRRTACTPDSLRAVPFSTDTHL